MELLLLLLIGGLFALWISNRDLKARLDALERRVDGAAVETLPAAEETIPYTVTYDRVEEAALSSPAKAGAQASFAAAERVQEDEPAGADGGAWAPAFAGEQGVSDAPAHPAPEPETLGGLFERFVGGRLLIWLGGIALVAAAVYLVRYSIEIGLVTPALRMIAAAVFGLVLIGAGEAARWKMADDPRIAQALVGAGVAVLYAAAYGAHALYGLIGPGAASGAMLAITGAALGLSLRHGAPTAVMGLIGGFLTPLLVGDPEAGAVPLLAYLGLIDVAIFLIAWRRGWTWLAAAAVALSFVWSAFLLAQAPEDALASGVFIVLLAVAATLVRPGEGRSLRLIQPLLLGLAQLAFLAARSDIDLAGWALFGALAIAAMVLAALRREARDGPPVALALALLVLLFKAGGYRDVLSPEAALGITAIFGMGGLALAWLRGGRMWTAMACGGLAGPVLILRAVWPELMAAWEWGLAAALLTLGSAALIWRLRARATAQPPADLALLMAGAAAALLAGAAVWDLAPAEAIIAGWVGVGIALALAARRLGDLALAMVALAVAAVAVARSVWLTPELSGAAITATMGFPALATGLPGARVALFALAIPAALLGALRFALPAVKLPAIRILGPVAAVLGLAAAYLWFKQAFGLASSEDFEARGFLERTILTQALFAIGWLLASGRLKLPRLDPAMVRLAGTAATILATARLIWFDMLVHNPVLMNQNVGALPVLNLLLPAFLGSAVWLYAARLRQGRGPRSGFWLAAFLAALIVGVALLVCQAFQGPILTGPEMSNAEFYSYSLAGLLLSIGLLLAGVRLPDKALRIAGLALLTATMVKVFLIDAAALEEVLRILSFLGLGIVLIAIGRLYGPILRAEAGGAEPLAGAERKG